MKSTHLISLVIFSSVFSIACASSGLAQQQTRDAKADLNIQPGTYSLVALKISGKNLGQDSGTSPATVSPYCEDNTDINWFSSPQNSDAPVLIIGQRLGFGDFNQVIPPLPVDPLDPQACVIAYETSTLPGQMTAIRRETCKNRSDTTETHLEVQGTTLTYSIETNWLPPAKPSSNRIDCVLKLKR